MKLDCNIYGEDKNGMANAAASKALAGTKLDDMGDLDQGDQSRSAKDTLRLVETQTVRKAHPGQGSSPKSKGN